MDDTAQKQANDSTQPQVQAQPAVRTPLDNVMPQPPVVIQTAAQPQPQAVDQPQAAPVGSMHKEAELAPVSDFVKLTETSPIKDKEVAEAGVAEVLSAPELTREHEQIGVKASAEATPVKIEDPVDSIRLPMNEIQASQITKGRTNIRSSVIWLAILMLKHFKQMRRNLSEKGV
jgi:hypothetical protein